MRILFMTLLLTGCSMAELSGGHLAHLEEQKRNERILHAEQECAVNGLVIGTREYDKCLYEELKEEPQLIAQLEKLKADFAKRAVDGVTVADSKCEAFGYYRGTAEYKICLEYARENNIGGAGNNKTSRR